MADPQRCRDIAAQRARAGGVPAQYVVDRLAMGAAQYGDDSYLRPDRDHRRECEEEIVDAYAYACMFEAAAEAGSVIPLDDADRSDLAQCFAAINRLWYVWQRLHRRRSSRVAAGADCAGECRGECLTCDREQ